MARTAFAYRHACRRLPASQLRLRTYKLASEIAQATGMITVFSSVPVGPLMYGRLGLKLPHIAKRLPACMAG